MNKERSGGFTEGVEQALDLRLGGGLAEQAVVEALMSTLFTAFPPLAQSMRERLELTAQHHREQLAPETPTTHLAFENRIDQTVMLLDALQGS